MGYRIPEETIETIRRTVDIVDVISDYVQLKNKDATTLGYARFTGRRRRRFLFPQKSKFSIVSAVVPAEMYFRFLWISKAFPFLRQ